MSSYLQHYFAWHLNGILPFLVCGEIICLLILCKRKGISFAGAGLILVGMIFFFIGASLNLLTSFGFFIVPVGADGSFTTHPIAFIVSSYVYIPAWLFVGIGIYLWFREVVQKEISAPHA